MFVAVLGKETPSSTFVVDREVFIRYPSLSFMFIAMAVQTPFPEHCPDLVIYISKGVFADTISVVVSPTSENGVEMAYYHLGRN